jgi:hypothetical protein
MAWAPDPLGAGDVDAAGLVGEIADGSDLGLALEVVAPGAKRGAGRATGAFAGGALGANAIKEGAGTKETAGTVGARVAAGATLVDTCRRSPCASLGPAAVGAEGDCE